MCLFAGIIVFYDIFCSVISQIKFEADGKVMKIGTLKRFQVGNKDFWEAFSFVEVREHKSIWAQVYLVVRFSPAAPRNADVNKKPGKWT